MILHLETKETGFQTVSARARCCAQIKPKILARKRAFTYINIQKIIERRKEKNGKNQIWRDHLRLGPWGL